MALSAEHQRYVQSLTALRKVDQQFHDNLEPEFHNHVESRDTHHRSGATWAGEEQDKFGQHRRGPAARNW